MNSASTLWGKLCALLFATLLASAAQAQEAPPQLVGINVAGAGFSPGTLPGKHGTNYFFPPPDYFVQWKERGITWVRFSIVWERLQPQQFGDFDADYAARIDKTLEDAKANGIRVMLDVHNYGRYYGKIIGDADVPIKAYQDLMERIAERWSKDDTLYAYDLMNEPYGDAERYWFDVAQAGIDGVRKYDKTKTIYVEGRSWSSAQRWPGLNDDLLKLVDPADNLVFSAHIYADKDSSGLYKQAMPDNYDPMVVVKRVEPFVEWLRQHGKRGHLGEFGVPNNDPRWLPIMDNLLSYLQQNCIPVTYWAAGPSWGRNYHMSIEPLDGKDRPQWPVLQKYLGSGSCEAIGPKKS
ncbi:glycoside hydrolase family 5 protein [Pseudomonas sp. PS02288]|uniref:glycoside hydrolase family 5 protein n=1 Tax=Pseudomonas sp. PS02288 TaxID=2991443 RepID=UPI00249C9E56|nr:glycoside hydrolase family 5 protein [Pseudomonas sp. PS02288]